MARKTFISYKYSEARELRDKIIHSLGDGATFYQGETAESPDLTEKSVEVIKNELKDMIYSTSVTILIISPNIVESEWIDWEIEYSLKEIKRGDKNSRTNGIVGVVMKYEGGYDWLISNQIKDDGCVVRSFKESRLYDIIKKNRFNLKGKEKYTCEYCKCFDALSGSYISLIKQEDFLNDPDKYIENAFDKSLRLDDFNITKEMGVEPCQNLGHECLTYLPD